jgi:phosphatidylglycerol:prolipoprotein diacylglycerol transferase
MRPVLFSPGGVEISSYAVMLCLGACLGFWLTLRESERKGGATHDVLMLASVAFVSGLIGARGMVLLLAPSSGTGGAGRPWWSLFLVWESGGMAIFGGLALAAVTGLAFAAAKRLPLAESADTLAVAWTPFVSAMRVGCFLNGCCYGRPTLHPFGVVAGGSYDNARNGIPSHPAQLYELAATLAIFGLLWWRRTRRSFEGEIAALFLVLYGAFRIVNEFFRGDIGGFPFRDGSFDPTFNQWIALVMMISGGIGWAALAHRPAKKKGGAGAPPSDS